MIHVILNTVKEPNIGLNFLGSCYLLFANRAHIVQLQNVPSVRVDVALTGFSNAVAVDFDKRY